MPESIVCSYVEEPITMQDMSQQAPVTTETKASEPETNQSQFKGSSLLEDDDELYSKKSELSIEEDDLYDEVPKSVMVSFKQMSDDLKKEKPVEDKASIMLSKLEDNDLENSFEVQHEDDSQQIVEDKVEQPEPAVTDSTFAKQLQEQLDESMLKSKAKADEVRNAKEQEITVYLEKMAGLSDEQKKYRNQLMTFMQMDLLDFDKNLEALEKSHGSVSNATTLLFSVIE